MMWSSFLLIFIFSHRGMWASASATDILIVYANSTAETELGEDALLHCRFETGKPNYKGSIEVIWRSDDQYNGPIIFQCSNLDCSNVQCSNSNCSNSVGRFSLVGNIEDSNVSLLIKNTTKEDEKLYFCRVEMAKSDRFTTLGTLLTLTVPPKLHSIYFRIDEYSKLFVTCIAIGDPPLNVTWVEPDTTPAPNEEPLSVNTILSSIPAKDPNGMYSCQINTRKGTQKLSIVPYMTSSNTTQDFSSSSQCDSRWILILLVVLCIFIVLTAVATILAIFFWHKGKPIKEPDVQPTYGNIMPPPKRQQRMNIYKEMA